MSKVIEKKQLTELVFSLDYLVENPEYQNWKSKLEDQILKNVEVKGFRKGKAPKDKAKKQMGEEALATSILQETLQKYANEAISELKKEVEKKKRIIANYQVDINPENTKETEKGFQFRVVANLLPNIDLKALDKIKIKQPSEKDIKGRPELANFIKQEKENILSKFNVYEDLKRESKMGDYLTISMTGKVDNKEDERLTAKDFNIVLGKDKFLPDFEKNILGLKKGDKKTFTVTFPADYFEKSLAKKKVEFAVKIKELKQPKYSDVENLLKNNKKLAERFKSEKDLEEYLTQMYQQQTMSALKSEIRGQIIREVVEKVPNFALPENAIESETNRITETVKSSAEQNKMSVGQALIQTGLPGTEDNKVSSYDIVQAKSLIEKYVRKEFKLSAILNYIYETEASDKKIKPEEMQKFVKEALENKEKYNINKDASETDVRNIIHDRLIRQIAINHLIEKFVGSEKPKTVKKKVAKKGKK